MAQAETLHRPLTILVGGGAVLGAVLQLVAQAPLIGPLGLLLFVAPGFLVVDALAPRVLTWPQRTLAVLGSALVLAIAIGIVTALSPYGLDVTSVAAVLLATNATAATIAIWRLRPAMAGMSRAVPGLPISSVLLLGGGAALGVAGFGVATHAAQNQAYAEFVQFWSVPSQTEEQVVGIRNRTHGPLWCDARVDPPAQETVQWTVAALVPEESRLLTLPRNTTPDPRPWVLSLACTASDGTAFNRRLAIDPPR